MRVISSSIFGSSATFFSTIMNNCIFHRAIRQTHDCVHKGLRKCDDSTPENLVSSMLKVVAKSISCPPIYDPPSARRTTDSGSHLFSPILLMVAGAVLLSVLQ